MSNRGKDYVHPTGTTNYAGITKREAFAMAAMQGILANPYYAEQANSPDCYGDLSDAAIYHADALLAALAKEPK